MQAFSKMWVDLPSNHPSVHTYMLETWFFFEPVRGVAVRGGLIGEGGGALEGNGRGPGKESEGVGTSSWVPSSFWGWGGWWRAGSEDWPFSNPNRKTCWF